MQLLVIWTEFLLIRRQIFIPVNVILDITGTPLKINRAPGNIQGNLTGMLFQNGRRDWMVTHTHTSRAYFGDTRTHITWEICGLFVRNQSSNSLSVKIWWTMKRGSFVDVITPVRDPLKKWWTCQGNSGDRMEIIYICEYHSLCHKDKAPFSG